jgi:hypothetical protein
MLLDGQIGNDRRGENTMPMYHLRYCAPLSETIHSRNLGTRRQILELVLRLPPGSSIEVL